MSTAVSNNFMQNTIIFSTADFKYLPTLFTYCDEAQSKYQASKHKTTAAAVKNIPAQ